MCRLYLLFPSFLLAFLPLVLTASPFPHPCLPFRPTHLPPQCLALGDLDGNGSPDLVALTHEANGDLFLLLNQDGRLQRASSSLSPLLSSYALLTSHALLHDVNGDGWPDLILTGPAYDPIAVFLNRGVLHGAWQGLAKEDPSLR